MIEALAAFAVDFVDRFGYFGIFIMTALESTFLPIPSEATMVPAGYLVYQGQMNGLAAWLAGVLGTLAGSLVNYVLAYRFGRAVLIRRGRYLFLNEKKLDWIEAFFQKHGAVSVFTGRLIFGVRHFISFPAGLARMNLWQFCFYTTAGGALWMAVLLVAGYFIGGNAETVSTFLPALKIGFVVLGGAGLFWYLRRARRRPGP